MRKKSSNSFGLLRRGKFDAFLDAVAWSVPRWLFFYNHSILITTNQPRWSPCAPQGYKIRDIRPEDIRFLEKDGFTDAKILARLEAGDKGFLVEKDGQVASIIWGSRGPKFLWLSGTAFDPAMMASSCMEPTPRRKPGNTAFFTCLAIIYGKYQAEGAAKIGELSTPTTPVGSISSSTI